MMVAKFFDKRLVCGLALMMAASCWQAAFAGAPVSVAARKNMNFDAQGPLVEPMKEANAFIDNMGKEVDRLNDYSLLFETKTFKSGSSITEAGKLFFKKPKMMRIEETGEFNKGSVAVLQKDGKARARGGGISGLVVLTLKPDDKMLDAANGDKMEDSDLASLVKVLKERLKAGQIARVSEKPVTVAGVSEPAYILELFKAGDPKTCLKRVWVHPSTYLPLRWDDYDYKNPCLSTWKDVKGNVGLSDDLFKL
ncbi:MAG: hypothetical protein IT343_23025 [Candidatus Melainabacteria bacterium]|nr:hypothetical protein [Candidatus Melainabacteria bacterium]